ncbi:MAG: SCO family protein [Cyclobacteriaceae bacterium]
MRLLAISIFFSCAIIACSKAKRDVPQSIDLPFYNDPNFTPEWISQDEPRFDSIHTIAPFKFVNQNGDTISNEDFDGKVYATNFFFSICPNVCPKMKKSLSLVQDAYQNDERVKILSHTVMPWVDSVARLKEYAQLNDINEEKWHLVTGDKNAIYNMARTSYFADEGFDKTVTSEEDFLHTENVILIDQKRRIRGVYNGTLSLEMKRMMEDIDTLLK